MTNSGIIFGNQGPLMEGTWYNPQTGDSFVVKDSFFENNQYVISTTDGRVLGYDMIQNYIKSDKPIKMPKNQTKKTHDEIPAEVLSEIADDTQIPNDLFVDTDIYGVNNQLTPSLGNINKPLHYGIQDETPPFNIGIIKKALDKCSRPQVDCSIVWDNFPKKEIQMLNEIMEIDTKEIVEWYASQLDTTQIAIAIHNSIVSYINDQLYGRAVDINDIDLTLESEMYTEYEREPINSVAKESVMFVDETPVKSPKKTTPKKSTKKSKK